VWAAVADVEITGVSRPHRTLPEGGRVSHCGLCGRAKLRRGWSASRRLAASRSELRVGCCSRTGRRRSSAISGVEQLRGPPASPPVCWF